MTKLSVFGQTMAVNNRRQEEKELDPRRVKHCWHNTYLGHAPYLGLPQRQVRPLHHYPNTMPRCRMMILMLRPFICHVRSRWRCQGHSWASFKDLLAIQVQAVVYRTMFIYQTFEKYIWWSHPLSCYVYRSWRRAWKSDWRVLCPLTTFMVVMRCQDM